MLARSLVEMVFLHLSPLDQRWERGVPRTLEECICPENESQKSILKNLDRYIKHIV